MLEYSPFTIGASILALVLAHIVAKRTSFGVAKAFNVRHKSAVVAHYGYMLLMSGVIVLLLTYPSQPKRLVLDSLPFAGTAAKIVWNSTVTTMKNLPIVIVTGLAHLQTLLPNLQPTEIPSSIPDAYCEANPGPTFQSVALRTLPNWLETPDPDYIAARHATLKIFAKLTCVDSRGEVETWFEVRAGDGSKRYVSAEICSTDFDLSLLPDSEYSESNNSTGCTPP